MNAFISNGAWLSLYASTRRFPLLLVLICALTFGVFFLPPAASAAPGKAAATATKTPVKKTTVVLASAPKGSAHKKKAAPVRKRSRRPYVKSLMPQDERAALRDRGISSGFGVRAVSRRATRQHKGIDIPAPKDSKILAFNDGEVSFTGRKNGYGIVVIVKQIDGREALYAHMNKSVVKIGDSVKRGTHIGHVGRTGRATGYHLHFEIIEDGQNLDPAEHVWHGAELVLGPDDLDPAAQGQTKVASPTVPRKDSIY